MGRLLEDSRLAKMLEKERLDWDLKNQRLCSSLQNQELDWINSSRTTARESQIEQTAEEPDIAIDWLGTQNFPDSYLYSEIA